MNKIVKKPILYALVFIVGIINVSNILKHFNLLVPVNELQPTYLSVFATSNQAFASMEPRQIETTQESLQSELLPTKEHLVEEYSVIWGSNFCTSQDQKRFAYVALYGIVVIDEKSRTVYKLDKGVLGVPPIFSPDGKSVAYIVPLGEKNIPIAKDSSLTYKITVQTIGINEKIVAGYDNVKGSPPIFSPDSRHIAFTAKRDSNWFVVLDSKPMESYQDIDQDSLIFSPDSQHLAYKASLKGRKQSVILDGRKGPEFGGIDGQSLVFSNDSKHFAYEGQRDGKFIAVIDGEEGTGYDSVRCLTFSKDGTHSAYVARRSDKESVVIDGREGLVYDSVSTPVFRSTDSCAVYCAANQNQGKLVVNDKEVANLTFDGAKFGYLTISPDDRRSAYVVIGKEKKFVVIDGKKGPDYDDIVCAPFFSPDSKRIAYAAESGILKLKYVHIDDSLYGPYDNILPQSFTFSDDSKHWALFTCTSSRFRTPFTSQLMPPAGIWLAVIDGKLGLPYDVILSNIPAFHNSTVQYYALRKRALYVVRHDLKGS